MVEITKILLLDLTVQILRTQVNIYVQYVLLRELQICNFSGNLKILKKFAQTPVPSDMSGGKLENRISQTLLSSNSINRSCSVK